MTAALAHASPAGPAGARPASARERRVGAGRRAAILQAALDVLADHGVAGTTHRAIAARADVPLGSLTYYFPTLGALVAQAFALHVEQQTALLEGLFAQVRSRDEFVDALVVVAGRAASSGPPGRRDAVLGFELYLAACRDPALRAVTATWTTASRALYARFTDAETADALDALLEGLVMQALLRVEPADALSTRRAIARVLGPPGPAKSTPGT